MSEAMIAEVRRLARERKAVILAHTYTESAVQDAADFVGDSYGLSKKAASIEDAEVILFAGVRFMAETAAMLAPNKRVLTPIAGAGCPMADMVSAAKVRMLKEQYPDAAVVCYVNSDAATKAESDVCVTSSNAVTIVSRLPERRIIFVPDRHLGSFVAEQLPEKEFILHEGFCPVHNAITPDMVLDIKQAYPDAAVMMHPECPSHTRTAADYILSTGQMVEKVKEKSHDAYIIVTEQGIIHALRQYDADATFIQLRSGPILCENMKKITLPDLLHSLQNDETEVTVPESVAERARVSLEKMMELAE